MRKVVVALLLLGACYSARPAQNVPCSQTGDCPRGQRCEFALSPPTCVDDDTPGIDVDAAITIDAAIDAVPPPIPSGATLWLRFEDDPSDGALDSAGMHAALCTECPTAITGRVGMAHDFSNDRYAVGPVEDFTPGTGLTLALWFRPDTRPSDTSLATLAARPGGTGAGAPVYALFYTSAGEITFYSSPGGALDGPDLALGAWHHVAFVWDGTTKRGYVDGELVASELVNLDDDGDDGNPLGIGRYPEGLDFDGALDEVVFYPRALSAEEIMQLAD